MNIYSDLLYNLVKLARTIPDLGIFCRQNKPLILQLKKETNFLPSTSRVRERLWHVEHNSTAIPLCKGCNIKPVKWRDRIQAYPDCCSSKCAHNLPEYKNKMKNYYIDKYGVDHPWKNKEVQIKQKRTMKDRYGVENAGKSEVILQKTRATNLKKYGTECSALNEEVKTKRILTNKERYGFEAPMHNNKIKEKVEQTCLERYGVKSTLLLYEIQNQQKQTKFNKYGTECFSQSHISPTTLTNLNNRDWLFNQHVDQQKTLSQIAYENNVSIFMVCNRMKEYNIDIRRWNTSNAQRIIINWIKQNYSGTIITNDRAIIAPNEIDIYLPELNLAFEFNGIYWHSERNGKDKNYHLNKTNLCKEKQIRLVHIWESEWELKQEIVKSRIKSFIGQNKTIYARKCKIVIPSSNEYTTFINKNHIQGAVKGSIIYGLQYNNEIVAMMSFCKSRFSKKVEYELLRYANKKFTSVVGGASKLFRHFIKNNSPNSIISYSDERWNTGDLYKQLNFKHSHTAKPNYFYFKSSNALTLHSRQSFQKHKLKSLLDIFDPSKTEWENMQLNGYDRIWDCGNSVWIWATN